MNEIVRNKIKELFCSECAFCNKCAVDTGGCHVFNKAVELHKWTKEQVVEKACIEFCNNCNEQYGNCEEWCNRKIAFEKSMED